MNDTQQLDIQVNIEDDVLNANLGDEDLQSDFTMGIIAKEYENDYNKLKNQPQINGITLKGDKSAKDLGLVSSILSPLNPVESPTKSFRESSNIFVDNNGKSLKMTLQQVKEMGSKVARTSDEMNALLVEDNLGDLVTYLGESGGSGGGYDKNSVYKIITDIEGEIVAKKVDAEPELPKVTSADEGKFLRVNSNGVWVAEVVPRAEDLSV